MQGGPEEIPRTGMQLTNALWTTALSSSSTWVLVKNMEIPGMHPVLQTHKLQLWGLGMYILKQTPLAVVTHLGLECPTLYQSCVVMKQQKPLMFNTRQSWAGAGAEGWGLVASNALL